jgi:hypothetical protein
MRLFLRIDSAPGTLARVLEPFAVAGHTPRTLFLRAQARGVAFVVAEFEGPAKARAALFTEKLKQMPCVIGVRVGAYKL